MNESFIQGMSFSIAFMIIGQILYCLSDLIITFLKEYIEKERK